LFFCIDLSRYTFVSVPFLYNSKKSKKHNH
jgi:hypothetical protein